MIDTVRRGTMIRDVRGSGTLVPENQRFVSAQTAGRVDRVLVRPGTHVEADTPLIEISNPDVQLQALDAERQLKLAEADLANQRAALEAQRLAAISEAAAARTELRDAERALTAAERLAAEQLSSQTELEHARDRAEEARDRESSERERLLVLSNGLKAELDLRELELVRLRDIAEFQRQRVASMRVRAGAAGTVEELSLEPGQWVNPGQLLARVAQQDRLKAVVHIPESEARDLGVGLPALIDTRNGIVQGHVTRVDPAVAGGTVTVELAIADSLPRGSRPDLSVDATIEIERLSNALSVGRPAGVASESATRLFRLDPDGKGAARVAVQLGRNSASTVEIQQGLKEGDRVILSEMSRWDRTDRIRLRD